MTGSSKRGESVVERRSTEGQGCSPVCQLIEGSKLTVPALDTAGAGTYASKHSRVVDKRQVGTPGAEEGKG